MAVRAASEAAVSSERVDEVDTATAVPVGFWCGCAGASFVGDGDADAAVVEWTDGDGDDPTGPTLYGAGAPTLMPYVPDFRDPQEQHAILSGPSGLPVGVVLAD